MEKQNFIYKVGQYDVYKPTYKFTSLEYAKNKAIKLSEEEHESILMDLTRVYEKVDKNKNTFTCIYFLDGKEVSYKQYVDFCKELYKKKTDEKR